jgi:Fe(3+) dicitrate transport protein
MLFKKRALATLIPLLFVQPAFAAEDAAKAAKAEAAKVEKFTTEKVTVNGILPDNLEAVPGSFSVIDEEELQAKRPFSIQEALSDVPGINIVGEDALGLGLNIGIRGMDPRRTARTLLMEDGVPLFLAPYGDPSAHYSTPLERVERIEVVKGSGQILYGPQTVGGMINFVTKPVPRKGEVEGSVTASAGNNDYNGMHANVGYGNERGGIMFDALKKSGDGIRSNHKFDVQDYTLKGEFDVNERHTLKAKLGYYKEDSNISETGLGSIDYANDKFQAPTGGLDRFEHVRKSAQLQHIFKIDDAMKLSTMAYYTKAERSSFRQTDTAGGWDDEAGTATGVTEMDRCPTGFGGAASAVNSAACGGRHRPRSYNVWGVEPRLDFSHKLFGLENDAVVGFRYHHEDIKRDQYRGKTADFQSQSFAESFAGANGSDNLANGGQHRESLRHEIISKAAYVQNTFYMSDWALTPGVRVESYESKQRVLRAGSESIGPNGEEGGVGGLSGSRRQTEVLPGLGLAWNGIANTTVFTGVHRGFAPARPDRDLLAVGGNLVLDQTTPELSTNMELGLRSKYFKGVAFESTLFHTKFDDIVVNGGRGSYVNGGESAMSGVEVAGRVDFGTIYNTPHNFYVSGSYTNLFTAEFKKNGLDAASGITAGNRLPYAPKHLAAVNLGYQHPVGINARIGANYVSEQQPDAFTNGNGSFVAGAAALSGYGGTIPSYTLLNASFNFKPVGSKATYFVSGHNLADKDYLTSRVNGMFAGRGRTVVGGVRYQF